MIPRCPSSGASSYVKREPEVLAAEDGGGGLGMSVRGSGGLGSGGGLAGCQEEASLRLMETLGLGHGEGGGGSARVNLGSRQQKRSGDVRKGGGSGDRVVKMFGRVSADLGADAFERGGEDWALWEGRARGVPGHNKGSNLQSVHICRGRGRGKGQCEEEEEGGKRGGESRGSGQRKG